MRNGVSWRSTKRATRWSRRFTVGSDPVQKISIVPRGFGALGYTLQMPTEDRYLMTEEELLGKIDVLLGGRGAEELVFGKISTGAANDLTKATDIARRMITDYGMSPGSQCGADPTGRFYAGDWPTRNRSCTGSIPNRPNSISMRKSPGC